MSIMDTMGGALAGAGDSLFGAGTSDALMSAGGAALGALGGASEGALTGFLTGGAGGALSGAISGLLGGGNLSDAGGAPAASSAEDEAHTQRIMSMASAQGGLDAQLLNGALGGAVGGGAGLSWGGSSETSSPSTLRADFLSAYAT